MRNRWIALAIIFVSFLQFTLNWFCIIPGFGGIVRDMGLSFPQVGAIVGMFIAGYGLAHIPGGWLAERYGLRRVLLLGIAVESLGAALSGWAPSFDLLLVARFVCGVGGSIYLGSAVGLTTAWFRGRELATANAIITGVAFTVGAAIGLFVWGSLIAALGWRDALLVGAGVGAAILVFTAALYPVPPAAEASALPETGLGADFPEAGLGAGSLRRVLGSRVLWLMGLSFLGAYGSYFSAAQLLPHFAQSELKVSAEAAETLSVILLLSGVPGALLGGWLADRMVGVVPLLLGGCLIEGVALILVPHLGFTGLEIAAIAIGGAPIAAFVVWITIPGQLSGAFRIADIPTAVGLMLTIVAVGGAVVPPLYGSIASTHGYGAAWGFEGVVCLMFALVAFLAPAHRRLRVATTGPASR